MNTPTPGWKTMAFWASLILSVITALSAAEILAPGSFASKVAHALVIALAQMGYSTSRANVDEAWKMNPPAPATVPVAPPSNPPAG